MSELVFVCRYAYLMPGRHIEGSNGEEEVWTLTSFYSSLKKPESKQKIIRIHLNSALATGLKWFQSFVFFIALCCFLFWIAYLLNIAGQLNWPCPKCSWTLCGRKLLTCALPIVLKQSNCLINLEHEDTNTKLHLLCKEYILFYVIRWRWSWIWFKAHYTAKTL